MNVIISYKHLDSSEAVNEVIEQKSQKLGKYFHKDITAHWVCSAEGGLQQAELEVSGIGGNNLFAKASAPSLYSALDEVIQKVSRQARKKLTRENKKPEGLSFSEV